MKKKLKLILVLVLGAVVLISAVNYFLTPEKVNVFEISEKTGLKEVVKENGIVESRQVFSISPAFDGEAYINVKLGDEVKKGQALAVIDAEDLSSSIVQLEAQIRSVQAQTSITGPSNPQNKEIQMQKIKIDTLDRNLNKLNEDYKRTETLYNSGVASKVELENLKNALDSAEDEIKAEKEMMQVLESNSKNMQAYYSGQLQSLKAQKSLLISKKGKTQISSPINGIVTRVDVKDGQKVNSLMSIMEISEKDSKVLKSNLASEVAADLKVGDRVEVIYETKHKRNVYNGKISYIAPYSSTQLSSLGIEEQKTVVETSFNDLKNIPLGYKLDINFITLDKPNVVSIPKLSAFKIAEEYYVFKIEDDKLVKQKIVKGVETSNAFEILEGVSEGDIIVLDPNNKNIKEGIRVTY